MAKSKYCTGDIVVEKAGRQIINCRKCGYIHVYPLYSAVELEEYYENIYPDSAPSCLWAEKVYNIRRWKDGGAILDIGCWEGTQLAFFVKDGWQCTGIELNKRAAAIAESKGIEVYQLSIRQFFSTFARRKWDVINIAFLLEHIPDPAGFLSQIKKHLNKDGIIIVEVPNEFSPFQLAYLKKQSIPPYWIALPDHLNYFDKSGLENIMKRTGWTIIHGEGSFPMEMFLLMGDENLGSGAADKEDCRRFYQAVIGKIVELEKSLREYDPGLVSQMYSALYTCGIGRSNIVYARRS